MMQPRDQWFHVFGEEDKPAHVHHPDYYHPDPRVRVSHHGQARQTGIKITACGIEVDPRQVFVTEDLPKDYCVKCQVATELAIDEHKEALASLQAKAEQIRRERQEKKS